MTDTYKAKLADGTEVYSDEVPRVVDHGVLVVQIRDGQTTEYSPTAWVSFSYPTPESHVYAF